MESLYNIKGIRIFPFLILIFITHLSSAQSSSNKGTDFWLGYMAHINGAGFGGSKMSLYITSDVSTSGTISIPLTGYSAPFSVIANSNITVLVPASAYVSSSEAIEQKGIHVTSVLPIVVYSHIYQDNRSDATLALPTPTLGKEYYAVSYTQSHANAPQGGKGYSQFMIVGVEDNTQVEITPTQNTLSGSHAANVPFTITLNQGQVYQVRATDDLTGSHIITYSSGNNACKRVAVFSGSSWDPINSGASGLGSGDNLYQQLFPVNAWGQNFITVPCKTKNGEYIRILAQANNTSVSINGGASVILNAGQFYETFLTTASYITTSEPVTVAQFQRTQSCSGGSGGFGDPSMTIITPIEQTLNLITLYSTRNDNIVYEYINVVIKTADKASFRIDGNPASFFPVTSNPAYSYAQITVTAGNHTLSADSGFNAIAYGFGQYESYGYNAGANVKNLKHYISAHSNGIGDPHDLCGTASVDFDGAVSYVPTSIKWYFGDGTTSNSLTTSHTYNTPGSYTISFVTIRGSGGICDIKDSSTYTLNVYAIPVADFSFNDLCQNDSVHFQDLSKFNGSTVNSWKWYFGDADSSVTQNAIHHYSKSGMFTVRLIVKTQGGCLDTMDHPVNIKPIPVSNAGNDKNICPGSTTALSTVTGSGYTYLWTSGTGLTCSTCSSTSATPLSTQKYIVKTTANSCIAYDTVIINVLLPVANISPDTVGICTGGNISISTATQPGQTYLWSPAAGLSCSTCPVTIAAPSVATKYILTVTYNTCQTKDSVVVKVGEPDAGLNQGVCPGGSVTLTASPGGSGVSYQWSPASSLSCKSCQTTMATPLSLPATYYVSISSAFCIGKDSVVITANQIQANALGDTAICMGSSASLSATGGTTYRWSPSTGLSCTDCPNPIASPTSLPATYHVIASSFTCTDEDSVVITVVTIKANVRSDTAICLGNNVPLSASGGTTYHWSPSTGLSCTDCQSPVATPLNLPVTYQVTAISSTCTDVASVVISAVTIKATVSSDTAICAGKSAKLFASGGKTYQWSPSAGLSCTNCQSPIATPIKLPATYYVTAISAACTDLDSVIISPIIIHPYAGPDTSFCFGKSIALSASGGINYKWNPSAGLTRADIANPTASPSTSTSYTVTVTDVNGCTGNDALVITILNSFSADAGPDTAVCSGKKIALYASGGVDYTWQPNDLLSNNRIQNPIATVNGSETYTVSVVNTEGCRTQRRVFIEMLPAPFVFTTSDTTLCRSQPLQLLAYGATHYVWYHDDVLLCAECVSINPQTEKSADYMVKGIDENGCIATTNVRVVINSACEFVTMPNAFSPNRDGRNDLFFPVGKGIRTIEFSIYNRWGEKIFIGRSLNHGWDGKFNNIDEPEGAYVWNLKAEMEDGGVVEKSGNVTLIR